ncbi:hypothetical protein B484DRAFT_408062, partial [Ochromonadaceae sp. CCMP2298]
GYYTQFPGNLTFLTVRHAGHEVPAYQKALHMLRLFLSGDIFADTEQEGSSGGSGSSAGVTIALSVLLVLVAVAGLLTAPQPDYSKLDDHRTRDERIYFLRSLLFGALTVTAVVYGVAVYYRFNTVQQNSAGKEFKYVVEQAGKDIRKSFAQSAKALEYLAERYATTFPDESEWPTVMLPGFIEDLPYLRDTT